MAKKVKSLVGNEYNGIKVIDRDFEKEELKLDKRIYWKCLCHCGNIFSPSGGNLRSGNTKSCGCNAGGKGKSKNGKINEWVIENDIAIGITSNGEKFIIDLEDLRKVDKYCWRISPHGYVVANSKDTTNSTLWIHRVIMNPQSHELVDHISWDKLNNSKSNLRICNKSENNINIKKKSNNTSGYTGVHNNNSGNWVACISINNRKIYLGTFKTIEEAILVRSKAEKIIHKDFNGEINRKDFMKMIEEQE